VQTVAVNSSTGNLTYLLNNFIYTTGISITADGITTLDEETGMLFYSSDFEDSFIWTAQLTGAPSLQAPIDIGAYSIVDLKTDTKRKTSVHRIYRSILQFLSCCLLPQWIWSESSE